MSGINSLSSNKFDEEPGRENNILVKASEDHADEESLCGSRSLITHITNASVDPVGIPIAGAVGEDYPNKVHPEKEAMVIEQNGDSLIEKEERGIQST